MNLYSDDLNYLLAAMTGEHHAVGEAELPPTPAILQKPVDLVNIWRWFWYMTWPGQTGTIAGAGGADVTLPSSDSAMAVYDLADVDWLTPGMAYRVTGCRFCAEDWAA